MIVKKPSIFIYTHLADEAILREVCAGVEEEGVFYEITEFPDECMEKLSYSGTGFHAGIRNRDFWNGRLSENAGA